MTLQLMDEMEQPEQTVAGPVPPELHAFMDNAAAVSTRSADPTDAAAFIKFVTSPGAKSIWHKASNFTEPAIWPMACRRLAHKLWG